LATVGLALVTVALVRATEHSSRSLEPWRTGEGLSSELPAGKLSVPTTGGEHQTLCQDRRVHLTLGPSGVGIRLLREACSILTRISIPTEPFGRPG
jgi:hypothetical protein